MCLCYYLLKSGLLGKLFTKMLSKNLVRFAFAKPRLLLNDNRILYEVHEVHFLQKHIGNPHHLAFFISFTEL